MRYCSYLKSYSYISEQQTLFGTIILPTDILQQYIHCLKWDFFFKKTNVSSPDTAIKLPSYPNSAFASLFQPTSASFLVWVIVPVWVVVAWCKGKTVTKVGGEWLKQ